MRKTGRGIVQGIAEVRRDQEEIEGEEEGGEVIVYEGEKRTNLTLG